MPKILISGANQGLGFHLIEYLLQFPNNEIFLGSRSVEKGEEAAKKLRNNSKNHETSQVKVVQLDVTDDKSIKQAAASEDLKSLDILLNNAGVYFEQTAESNKQEQMLETYKVNVFGVTALTEAFIPALKNSTQRASIVNLGSELGSVTDRRNPDSPFVLVNALAYNTSKTALNGITAYYANALPEMRVVVVTPGYCSTNLNGNSGPNTPESGAAIIGKVALDVAGETGVFIGRDGIVPW